MVFNDKNRREIVTRDVVTTKERLLTKVVDKKKKIYICGDLYSLRNNNNKKKKNKFVETSLRKNKKNIFVETIVCVLWRRLDNQNFKCWPHVCKGSESLVLIRFI